jgi:hypothetical protein
LILTHAGCSAVLCVFGARGRVACSQYTGTGRVALFTGVAKQPGVV